MNQDSGWRKRQIALDIKAENARELGLDYEPNKTVIEMAREAGIRDCTCNGEFKCLEAFTNLVRADERKSWSLEMEAMERQVNILTDALAQEREACAKVADGWPDYDVQGLAEAIRARSNT